MSSPPPQHFVNTGLINSRGDVTSKAAMLHAALTPAAARLIVRCLDEKGDSAFVAAATAITTEAFGALGVYP